MAPAAMPMDTSATEQTKYWMNNHGVSCLGLRPSLHYYNSSFYSGISVDQYWVENRDGTCAGFGGECKYNTNFCDG